jgi:hypothetical protein
VQGGIGTGTETTAGQVAIMINDGGGRDQGRGRDLAHGREAVIDTLKGDPIARIGGTIHTHTGLLGEM